MRRTNSLISRFALYTVTSVGVLVISGPFLWMLLSSFQKEKLLYTWPPRFIPYPLVWENYVGIFVDYPFSMYLRNSLMISSLAAFGSVISCSLVAFGFARLKFRGRNVLFLVLLSTIIMPPFIVIVPRFILFCHLGWIDTFYPLIVPHFTAITAFNVFLVRQFFMGIPLELDEAARIDGCTTFGIYQRIILPVSKPVLAVVFMFEFINRWNDFLTPLIYLNSESKFTVTLGLNFLRGEMGFHWSSIMAASVITLLPCLIMFFSAQRFFIEGFLTTGIKA